MIYLYTIISFSFFFSVSDGKWEKPFGNRELDRKLNVLVDHFKFLGRLKSPDSECAVVVC